jgi:hypothetical protein
MPRTSSATIDEIIQNAIAPVVQRASAAIARAIAAAAEESVSRDLGRSTKRAPGRRGRAGGARPRRRDVEMTDWTADRRARRVPTFVIEATGLDTKKKIIAKFGEDATFTKGKPLPAPKQASGERKVAPPPASATRKLTAKPPRVGKAGAA